MKSPRLVSCSVTLMVGTALLLAQSKEPVGTQSSCRVFVQQFYNWYVSNSHFSEVKRNKMSALEFALKNNRAAFDPELVRQLQEGRTEADRDEEPFLDFDPVLDSQDPGERYVVENVSQKDHSCWADVHGVSGGKKSATPDVIAELKLVQGRWVFVDFHYPDSQYPASKSLLAMLKLLKSKQPKN